MFFEPFQLAQGRQSRVADDEAHYSHGQQSAFMQDVIAEGVNYQNQCEQHGDFHVFRHPATRKTLHKRLAREVSHSDREQDAQRHMPADLKDFTFAVQDHDPFECQNGG